MGERITVVGGTDSSIAVTLDGAQALTLAHQFVDELDNYYQNNQLNFLNVAGDTAAAESGHYNYGVITQGGAYSAGNGYNYIVAGGYNSKPSATGWVDPSTATLLDDVVTINSAMNSSQFIKVLAGNVKNFEYNANEESGQLAAGNVNNSVIFNGNTVSGGDWDIRTGQGDDTVITGAGNNSVSASSGRNTINITAGIRNEVVSDGQDTITASSDSHAINSVTLRGGTSQDYHAQVDINDGSNVTDQSYYNTVTVGGASTISGGTYGSYTFNGVSTSTNHGILLCGTSSTVSVAGGGLEAVLGTSNTIAAAGNEHIGFFNGGGNYSVSTAGDMVGFGTDGLNYTLNVTGDATSMFVADSGNETLDASGSTSGISIYANTVVGANTNFVATGGSGDDIMTAGTGNSTFTGGAGDNTFMFSKSSSDNGNTVITDFSKANDKIEIYDYGLDNDSLSQLLANSTNDANGNAVLKLTGHTITLEGVSVNDLTVEQFTVANPGTK